MKAPRILHYPGSKWSMVDWIIGNMPDHQTYLEPYFGSGAVFFNKEPADLETINDLDGDIVNLFRVIRECPDELAKLVHWTPYSREEYYASYETGGGRTGTGKKVFGSVLDGKRSQKFKPKWLETYH